MASSSQPAPQAPQLRTSGFFDHILTSPKHTTSTPTPTPTPAPAPTPRPFNHESGSTVALDNFAKAQAQAEGWPTSHYIGSFTAIRKAGDETPPLIPIMFRTVWPPIFGSRHALIHIKPAMDLRSLGRILDNTFTIVDHGGAVASTEIAWTWGHVSTPETKVQYEWEYASLGQLMNGIVEVRVEAIEEALRCACGLKIPAEEFVIKKLRMRCDRRMFKAMCFFCLDLRDRAREQEEEGRVVEVRELSWAGFQV